MRRFWPLATVLLGLGTFALIIAFSLLPSVRAAYPGGDFPAAMSDFQRAATPADLANVFGAPPLSGRIDAMQAANTLDLYGFIPVYALFLVAAGAMLGGGVKTPLSWLATAPVIVGAIGDVLETIAQLHVTSDWAHAAHYLPIAPFYWAKYLGLAVGALGVSAICLLGERKRFILACLGVAPLVTAVALYLKIGAPPLMTTAFGAFWAALIVIAIMDLVRARDVSP